LPKFLVENSVEVGNAPVTKFAVVFKVFLSFFHH